MLALDFFTADLLNGTKVYVLAVIEHGTRRIRILGATEHPVQSWVVQQARNLLMDLEDAGTRARFVLHDRDASFTATFDSVFQAAGIRVIRSAVQAPRLNSVMERWIGSCPRKRMIARRLRPARPPSPTRSDPGQSPNGGCRTSWAAAASVVDCTYREPGGAVFCADSGQGHFLLLAPGRRCRSGSRRPGAGRQDR